MFKKLLAVIVLSNSPLAAAGPSPDSRPLEWLRRHEGISGQSEEVNSWRASALYPNKSNGTEDWCGASIAAAVRTFKYSPPTHPAVARNWLNFGEPTDSPAPADVVVFWRESKGSWKGHVAFFLSQDSDGVTCIGGNQGGTVRIARYSKNRVLGFRRVK